MTFTSSDVIIFLDIDGVLNTYRQQLEMVEFNWVCVDTLNYVLGYSDKIKIIVSSSQRDVNNPKKIIQTLRGFGVDPDFEIAGLTPDLLDEYRKLVGNSHIAGHFSRGCEIFTWLSRNPKIDKFIILDDEDDGITSIPQLKDHFVHVDEYKGFTSRDVYKMIDLLKKQGVEKTIY